MIRIVDVLGHQVRRIGLWPIVTVSILVVAGIGLTVLAAKPPAPSPRVIHAQHGSGTVTGPSIDDPLTAVSTAPTASTPVSAPAPASPTTTSVRYGTTVSSVVANNSVSNPSIAIPEENAPGLVAVTTPLPSTIVLPPGSESAAQTVRYPNGVTEWVFSNSKLTHAKAIATLRAAMSQNGWAVTSESTDAPIKTPQGPELTVHHLYVASEQQRGVVNINGGPAIPVVTIQFDLASK